jgi:hypothetical protein
MSALHPAPLPEGTMAGWSGEPTGRCDVAVPPPARRQPRALVGVGPEAFAEARERNVPVLLSVGYAACHWCREVKPSTAVGEI